MAAITEQDVGKRIQQYIKDNGVKQTYLAERVGITDAKLSCIVNGQRDIDCIEYAKICKALGVDYGEFLNGIELEG